jgi:hypothetical protein
MGSRGYGVSGLLALPATDEPCPTGPGANPRLPSTSAARSRRARIAVARTPRRSPSPSISFNACSLNCQCAQTREVSKPGDTSASASNGCLLARSTPREPAPIWSTPAAGTGRAGEFPLMLGSEKMPSWLGKKCRQPMCLTLATQRGNNHANFAERSAPNRHIGEPMDDKSRRTQPNFTGPNHSSMRPRTMDDTPRRTQPNPRRVERSRPGRRGSPVLLLLSVVGISAVVFWATYGQGQLSTPLSAAAAQSAPQTQAKASDQATQSLDALRQSVNELQASQQHMVEQLDLLQRQLASEQGERKLLSEQVGALSGRVDGRSAQASSVTTGTAVQSPKRKPAPPAQ